MNHVCIHESVCLLVAAVKGMNEKLSFKNFPLSRAANNIRFVWSYSDLW